jgi:Holliday junction resolvase
MNQAKELRMVNNNYSRGRAYEYKVMKELRSTGWLVSRSAMSHGPVDVFAGKNGRRLLIQVKSGTGRLSKQARVDLLKWAKQFNAEAQVWRFEKSNGHRITILRRQAV